MLKHLKFLILLVLPFSLAMTLTSCSDDDNDVSDEESSLLVGSWEWSNDVEPEIWTLNSDGTCKVVVWWVGDPNDKDILTGKYSYDASTGILLMNLLGESKYYTYKVLHISKSELWIQSEDEVIILTRKIQ